MKHMDLSGLSVEELVYLSRNAMNIARCLVESDESFNQRVKERTGMTLESIPQGTEEDLIGGHIFCKRTTLKGQELGQEFVVGVGYPEQDSEGQNFYDEFVRVVLS